MRRLLILLLPTSCLKIHNARSLLVFAHFSVFLSLVVARGEDRPNVLFIAIDDLRPELGCYGAQTITPNIDALAKSGVVFDRAYCNQAVCGASRLSLMTGLYPERTGERSFHITDWRKRLPEVVTLNQHFLGNGYRVVGMGKVYHSSGGNDSDPNNWSQWISVRGSQSYANAESLENRKESVSRGRKRLRGPATEAGDTDGSEYSDTRVAISAVETLRRLTADQDQPFFLAVGFSKPHLPFVAPQKFWDLYDRDSFVMPDNAGVPPGYPESAAELDAGELRSYADIPSKEVPPTQFPDALNQRLLHGYQACVSYVDHNVGSLLSTLKASGARENTIVVLWGDHGWKLGDHSSWCKHTNFECDTRVPLIVRVPGKATGVGEKSSALVELIDLYPTLCDLAGVPKPAHLQGNSFQPVLAGKSSTHRDLAYSSYAHSGVVGHSVRSPRFRYTEWWKKGSDEIAGRALTDIETDPGETTSALEEQPELAEQLSTALREIVLKARK